MRKRGATGFTLIELMITVGIIGIMASIAIPSFQAYVRKSRRAEPMTMFAEIYAGASNYFHTDYVTEGTGGTAYTGCVPSNTFTPMPSPPFVVGQKKIADFTSSPDWKALGVSADGPLSYSYLFGTAATTNLWAMCLPGSTSIVYDVFAGMPYRGTTSGKAMFDVPWMQMAVTTEGIVRQPGVSFLDAEGSLTSFPF